MPIWAPRTIPAFGDFDLRRARLPRACRAGSRIGDLFCTWPATAASFARCHTDSTRERAQAGAAAIRSS
jgi:hypothetical protein